LVALHRTEQKSEIINETFIERERGAG
jgi:hypothetical protein